MSEHDDIVSIHTKEQKRMPDCLFGLRVCYFWVILSKYCRNTESETYTTQPICHRPVWLCGCYLKKITHLLMEYRQNEKVFCCWLLSAMLICIHIQVIESLFNFQRSGKWADRENVYNYANSSWWFSIEYFFMNSLTIVLYFVPIKTISGSADRPIFFNSILRL